MKTSILNKLAFRSIFSHKQLYFPFLLAVSLLFSLEYILLSLMQNEYVLEFHPDLKIFVGMGIFFSTLLMVIISLYTSNFIQKNQTKEFGLYTVLGLEKKHIRWITFVQMLFNWIVTSIFSVVIGYLTGNLMFVGLNRLMKDTGAGLMDYPFQIQTALGIVALLLGTFLVSFIFHSIKISRLNPTELFVSAHKGQREPKGNWLVTVLGLATLGSGYYIALTTNDVLGSLMNIFIAIFLIVIGTYLLFLSLSIFILKALQKNKRIYYKKNNFLLISGMLHRMNNNAVSLASIAILCSGIILVLGLTTTLYRVMETQIASSMPTDYTVQSFLFDKEEDETYLINLENELEERGQLEDAYLHASVETNGYFVEQTLIPLTTESSVNETLNTSQSVVLIGETIDTYNEMHGEAISLSENEVAISSNLLDVKNFSTMEINGKEVQTKVVSDDAIPATYGVEVIYLAFSDENQLEEFRLAFENYMGPNEDYAPSAYQYVLNFNIAENKDEIQNYLNERQEADPIRVTTIEETSQNLYTLYGGLLFIGVIVSIVLIVGIILMLYFKQITEGHQDRENYRIMKQVGLEKSMIEKTIQSQIVWVFGLPLAVAVLHNLFVSKIVYTLVGLFGVRDLSIFGTSYFGVLVVFAAVYWIFYKLTSRTYYRIINE